MSRRGADLPVRHGRQRRHGAVGGVLRFLAIGLAVVAVSSVSLVSIAVAQTVGQVHGGVKLAHLGSGKAHSVPQVGAIEGPINMVLVGTDTRDGQAGFQDRANRAASSGYGSNDVTMVLHVSADHTRAVVVSIPRDLMTAQPACPRPGGGTYPATSRAIFNSSLSRGGLPCTVLTVEKLTGLQVDYAAEISFDGVIAMSDAVGGVTVCLASPAVDANTGLNLPAGEQTIQGGTALAFLRSRHGVGDGSDLGRISSQQSFLSALMRKVTSSGTLSNPVTLYSLANAALKNMTFSDTLSSPVTMVSMAAALKGIGLQNMAFVQYPTRSDPIDPNRVAPITADAAVLSKALVTDQPITLSGKLGRATVANPNAPSTAPPATGAPTTGPSGSASSTPAPAASAVALPQSITGQTADQQTCAKGNPNG